MECICRYIVYTLTFFGIRLIQVFTCQLSMTLVRLVHVTGGFPVSNQIKSNLFCSENIIFRYSKH